jgi:cytochrome b pre-mRNA-processing protein 3
MVVVHLYLVLEKLRMEEARAYQLSRALVEAFVADMDDSLRELGVGDLSVPRKVKKAAGALYDCSRAFRAADTEDALSRALQETLLTGNTRDAAPDVAGFMRRAEAALASVPLEMLLAGRVQFPEP